MLPHVTLACFAASYAVALALEIARLWFRGAIRNAATLIFSGLGLLTHTLFLVGRVAHDQPPEVPLSSWFDWYLLAAWLLAAFYLYLSVFHERNAVGIFILPLVLVLVGVAAFFADQVPFARAEASNIWGLIHGLSLLLGVVAVSLGFIAGLMYLAQAYRLKKKLPPIQGFRLPSLEWLERINLRALVCSAVLLGLGVLSGIVLNEIYRLNEPSAAVPWSDPAVLSTTALFLWMVVVLIFNMVYRPARSGRKVAYLTVASFVFLAMILAILLFIPTHHVSKQRDTAQAALFFSPPRSPI
ncbi:MAG TPA: cytochrome c biogenesis protein CcsA [Pirellulales bacterium]|jgi:ABC-type uncharacterized transport system permease subunit|nr:cytochrome c biogenesis protein CcsA [Pirellulales bacterium]